MHNASMFTGIIESLGRVAVITDSHGSRHVRYEAPFAAELAVDDSVSVNGVCQTVVACDASVFETVIVEETLRKTAFGELKAGAAVNLERSLRLGDRLDGHLVQGHVDTVGRIEVIEAEGTNWLVTVSYPEEWAGHIVGRGSIAVDGISLTVARLERIRFTVAIIPYTWSHTNLGGKRVGEGVNLEFDLLGKYLLRRLELQKP
jgi:riboflavin synthase